MTRHWKLVFGAIVALAATDAAWSQVVFFESDNFAGHSYIIERAVPDLARFGFSNRASSAIVRKGQWQLCDTARFGGRCVTLRPGRYASLASMDMNNRISSARRAPAPKKAR